MTSLPTKTPVWKHLESDASEIKAHSLKSLFINDAHRIEHYNLQFEGISLNYAFQHLTNPILDHLLRLAEEQKVPEWRQKMITGEKINDTEKRAVLHTALRQLSNAPLQMDGRDIVPEIQAAKRRISSIVSSVREGIWRGITGKPIRHIVNIGIGGSDLGPRFVATALEPYISDMKVDFVANADAYAFSSVVKKVNLEETLFIIVSKTFTTQETLLNALTIRRLMTDQFGLEALSKHFIAVTVEAARAKDFGIPAENIVPIWEWIGGRFSLWSAVGLSLAIVLGTQNFDLLLKGAAAMDRHFIETSLKENMPVVMALTAIWNRNFLKTQAHAILPYSERLRELPRYLQQLEMESNGKTATRSHDICDYATAPIVFGEAGTVGQHSFYQLLHQGKAIIPADFVGVVEDDLGYLEHHKVMLANMVAQASALAFGQNVSSSPRDLYEGGRPSNLILIRKVDPYHVGLLLALYEHKIFVEGIIWNLNSFDQPGVELGKKLARQLMSYETNDDLPSKVMKDLYDKISRN